MGEHDAFFKTLFHALLGDLLEIVAPEIAEALDLTEVELVRDEFFTDLPRGSRRQPDLLASVAHKGATLFVSPLKPGTWLAEAPRQVRRHLEPDRPQAASSNKRSAMR